MSAGRTASLYASEELCEGEVYLYDQYAIDSLVKRAESAEQKLNRLREVLGPTVPTSVTSAGARCEWEEALKILGFPTRPVA
jgi:hypothetical protein